MKKINPRIVAVIIVLLIAAGIAMYRYRSHQKPVMTYVSEQARRKGPCPGKEEKFQAEGKSYRLLTNWYACHPVERGDLVYLRFSDRLDPVVRRVYGIPKDHFKVTADKAHRAWNLLINEKMVVDQQTKPRFFGAEKPPLLSLYEKTELKPGTFIVFAEASPGSQDSGTLGVVNSDDFLGKVELVSQ
jgi:hypothetical protein